ncbi:DUF362 domain-containing protein [Fuchsiella alkaliacetigena]|uniref:DUF362 domain-containing protein n=1 Tax=Fuchsiella alkaliacetigena TaxID=957042 RepID=UPI002009E485|nr:DUF362 domain-containing protein [Fuchsiella alkaliacetigena]MCK8824165.1 DUF362 domain-containing protein [Fuchsiella alkaliacetigena]
MSTVAAIDCPRYEADLVKEAVREAIAQLGGWKSWLEPGDVVLVKPNLLSPKAPEQAITTHPLVLKAVLELLQELEVTPLVGESSGGFMAEKSLTEEAFIKTGVKEVCEELSVKLINFDRVKTQNFTNQGETVASFKLPELITEVDFIISLPKLKTHSFTLFTGAVKNLYGLIPGLKKMEYHRIFPNPDRFGELIVDLLATVKPDLAIMDGIIGLAGDGPGSSGIPCKVGTIMASRDLVALDTVAANYLGYDDQQIYILNSAAQRGLGKGRLKEIELCGDFKPADYQQYDLPSNAWLAFLPNFLLRPLSHFLASKPQIEQKKCVNCRVCLESCPQLIIKEVAQGADSYLEIDVEDCIKCLCCQEVCPNDAISLQESLVIKLLRKL